jgi:uncharacterized protein YkwD
MMHRRLGAAICLLAGCLALPARADIIITTAGGKIVGKIIEEKDAEIRVRTEKGSVITIPREEIDSITREKLEDVFARRARAVKEDDAKGQLLLGNYARDLGLPKQATECWEKVLKLEPDNIDAHQALGYEKVDGKWLKGDDAQKAKGLVQYNGEWVTPEDKSCLEQGLVKKGDRWITKDEAEGRTPPVNSAPPTPKPDAKPDGNKAVPGKDAAPPPPIELPDDEKELLKLVSTGKPDEKRTEAVKALVAKGETETAAVKAELLRLADQEKKKLLDFVKQEKNGIRAKMAALVAERRKAALAFIFDLSKYPDADHGAVGQPEVDRLVNLLRQAWQDPLRELKTEKKVAASLDELKKIQGFMSLCQGSFSASAAEEELAKEADKIIQTSKIPLDNQDAQIMEASAAALKWNETAKTSLSAEERICLNMTNEYRMMFGLVALRAYEPLIQAARKHSIEMVERNYFSHDSPVAANRSPSNRCHNEGASYTGENIAMGSGAGAHAFQQWYTSSGHNRNMLGRHKSIGLGVHETYWTEDFGSDSPQ